MLYDKMVSQRLVGAIAVWYDLVRFLKTAMPVSQLPLFPNNMLKTRMFFKR
jgi:hypothetical protein